MDCLRGFAVVDVDDMRKLVVGVLANQQFHERNGRASVAGEVVHVAVVHAAVLAVAVVAVQ